MTSRFSVFVAIGILGALAPRPARAEFADLYSAGHADIAVDYDASSGLSFFYELSSTAVVNGSQVGGAGASADPSTISVVVPESVLTTGDSRLPAPFAGNPIYLILQTSQGAGSRPFLGFGAEEIAGGIFTNDTLSYTLTGFSSSTGGDFVLYSNGNWANPDMNTTDGLSGSDFINIFAGGHDHYNLGFTTAGTYDLTLTASGSLVGGGEVSTSAVFHFLVGDVSPPAAVPEPGALAMAGIALGAAGLVASHRRRVISRVG
jgi:surface-anchored protein